jgi:hypothetical protein
MAMSLLILMSPLLILASGDGQSFSLFGDVGIGAGSL